MFRTRLLSGILLMIIALVTLITGGNVLFFILLLISLIGIAMIAIPTGIISSAFINMMLDKRKAREEKEKTDNENNP